MSKTDEAEISQKNAYFGENVRKFLQNKFFWLLSKIESIDVFFPLKYGAVNCVFYDYTKTRCLGKIWFFSYGLKCSQPDCSIL